LHYAELCATHANLAAKGLKASDVTPASHINHVPSTFEHTQAALTSTNLAHLPKVDTVVLGLVHRLPLLTGPPGTWSSDPNDVFGWTIQQIGKQKVAFIGCRVSFWGNISGEVIKFLAARGVREVSYFGKLGTTREGIRPNRWLASGEASLVEGRTVEWENALASSLGQARTLPIILGKHVTVPSVLHETKDWLSSLPTEYSFVDPEVSLSLILGNCTKVSLNQTNIYLCVVLSRWA
jgi:hypothetical protein